MAEFLRGNLDRPDEVIEFPKLKSNLVELGELTVGLIVTEPGWRWSVHIRPKVGGEWCQARHIGVVLSGRLGIDFSDGTTTEFGRNEVFDIPAGHDGITIGDEPCVQIELSGIRAWVGFPTGMHSGVLATLLFTDIVDSTVMATQLGDARWRALLSAHLIAIRGATEHFGGRKVATTGDGVLATFDGPARALKGLDGQWHLSAFVGQPLEPSPISQGEDKAEPAEPRRQFAAGTCNRCLTPDRRLQTRPTRTHALWPPRPIAFESATSTCTRRASFGT